MYGRFVFIVLVILAVLQSPRSADAVPASPELIAVSQPDKTSFKVRQWGDEHLSGFETEDGYSVIFDEAAKIWYYAEKAGDGALVPSSIRVGIDPLPVDHQKHLRPTPLPVTESQQTTSTLPVSLDKSLGKSVAAVVIPTSGTKKIPVILANFSDTQFTYTQFTYTANDFYNLLFGTGTFSMKDYFTEISYGNLTIAPGSSDVVGPVTVSQKHDYYGQTLNGINNFYKADLVYDAVKAADAQINFADYSLNGSCTVENVVIVHQGNQISGMWATVAKAVLQ